MDVQKDPHEGEVSNFKIGDLIRYVRVQRGISNKIWQRSLGVGIVVSAQTVQGIGRMYDVMSDGEIFNSLEIYAIN